MLSVSTCNNLLFLFFFFFDNNYAGKAVVVSEYANIVVRSVSCELRLPSVIALKQFRKNPIEAVPSMTRRKVFIRDGFRCQVSLIKWEYVV